MSYGIVIGDLGPPMPVKLTEDGAGFVIDPVNDTIVLRYTVPATGEVKQVTLSVVNAPTGDCERVWTDGDLPNVGNYYGLVKVTRAGDTTFPRTFPNDGNKVIWPVYSTI